MEDITREQLGNRDVIVLLKYDVLADDNDRILIVLPIDQEKCPDNPVFYYGGQAHGILVSDGMPLVICDNIHKDVRKKVENCDVILFCACKELGTLFSDENHGPMVEFMAPVHWQKDIQLLAQRLIDEDAAIISP